ncbi:MAG TPA: isoprenylcysteine carboxylmethyltransferase family protein [Candidatus Acidoferrales bacterium]|nr:isoprenylcysteine carboxylmethyltransferase family protein [Candidatus Acidoferrales bacterium]
MKNAQAGASQDTNPGMRWLTAAASLAAGAAFLGLWFWLLPGWLGFHVDAFAIAPWRWIAAAPSVLGFAVAIRCIWNFGWTGHGTPMPLAPPQKLVVVGFYRYVRNPMYVGSVTGWIGLWVILGRASRTAFTVLAMALAAVALFVYFYEEPTLRKKFGADYQEYCKNVPRWLPRFRPWTQPS